MTYGVKEQSMNLEARALKFATEAHGSIGQLRKYIGEPYITHPMAVAEIVRLVDHTPEMIAAALLHDTVEDTPVTSEDIHGEFGSTVGSLVDWLTDVSIYGDGNRAIRKMKDLEHISKAPTEAKTIKLADLIDNTKTIALYGGDFREIYSKEKAQLLEVLKKGDNLLWTIANEQKGLAPPDGLEPPTKRLTVALSTN